MSLDAVTPAEHPSASFAASAPRAASLGMVACQSCLLVCEDTLTAQPDACCPRCGHGLRRRLPDSIARAWALLITAIVLYIPANLLPMMYTSKLGVGEDSTILRGIVEFWQEGQYAIALLIFVASVLVPCGKFLALFVLLRAARPGVSPEAARQTRLFHLLEIVGYWSMLDVLTVGWGVALGVFGALSDAQPRIGILFFGLVVMLTMMASLSLDPRLIWDEKSQ